MFKYKYLIFSALAILLASCKKDNIQSFHEGSEIFFKKFFENEKFPGTAVADSTISSFFFYPDGTQTMQIPVVVSYSGIPMDKDFDFSLKVVPEGTTANPDEYSLAPSYKFRSRIIKGNVEINDTIYIKANRSARMNSLPKGVTLTVELVPNEVVGVGQTERRKAKIIITTLAGKPDWWTTEVTNNLLGAYSEKKFKIFLNEIDKNAEMNAEFIRTRPDNAKKMALAFKIWLLAQNPAIREDNGDLMTVPI